MIFGMHVVPLPTIASIITGSAQIYRQIPTGEMMTISFGHVEDTGRFNVISDTITLLGTVRAIRQEVVESINQKLTDLAHHSAELAGCTAEIEFLQQVPPVSVIAVLRDVLTNRKPAVWLPVLIIFGLRVISVRHRWSLPSTNNWLRKGVAPDHAVAASPAAASNASSSSSISPRVSCV